MNTRIVDGRKITTMVDGREYCYSTGELISAPPAPSLEAYWSSLVRITAYDEFGCEVVATREATPLQVADLQLFKRGHYGAWKARRRLVRQGWTHEEINMNWDAADNMEVTA